MRCPKCGFITFDHSESCGKCGKNISTTASQLNGAGYNVAAPSFLQLNFEEDDQEIPDEVEVAIDEETGLVVDSEENAVQDDDFLELGVTDDEDREEVNEEFAEGIEFSPGALNEEEDTTDDQASQTEPTIDFNGIDLSDLAPPETAERDDQRQNNTDKNMIFEPSTRAMDGDGLEDLQLDDIDIGEAPISFSTEEKEERASAPTKTGTALDEFDFDLGEL